MIELIEKISPVFKTDAHYEKNQVNWEINGPNNSISAKNKEDLESDKQYHDDDIVRTCGNAGMLQQIIV